MSSAYENAMSNLEAENYTQPYPPKAMTQPQTDEQWIDELLDTLAENCADSAEQLGYVKAYEYAKEAKAQILQKMNEVYKNGYVKGGIDEILRHDKATQEVMADIQNSEGDV